MNSKANSRAGSSTATAEQPPPAGESVLRVADVVKTFRRQSGAVVAAVDHVSFTLAGGEFLVLLGPSGCGKTTLLRMIAGLEDPDDGVIAINGRTVHESSSRTNVPTERRQLSMIFQSYALWPHMTAAQNIAYPLKCRRPRPRRQEIREAVDRVLNLVHVPELARQYPHQMSGGQQQRVALARALVAGSDLVLFDEPLSNVDAQVREELRFELLQMQRELGFAAVYVTHDQTEAMGLADRIAVMNQGVVVQLGTPREIYEQPTSTYIADFVGTSNHVPVTVNAVAGGKADASGPFGEISAVPADVRLAPGDTANLVWRPEHASLSTVRPEGSSLRGTVQSALFFGPHVEYLVQCGDWTVRSWTSTTQVVPERAEVWITPDPGRCRVLKD